MRKRMTADALPNGITHFSIPVKLRKTIMGNNFEKRKRNKKSPCKIKLKGNAKKDIRLLGSLQNLYDTHCKK